MKAKVNLGVSVTENMPDERKGLIIQDLLARWENTVYSHQVNYKVGKVVEDEGMMQQALEGIKAAIEKVDAYRELLSELEVEVSIEQE